MEIGGDITIVTIIATLFAVLKKSGQTKIMKYSGKILLITPAMFCAGTTLGATITNGSFAAPDGIEAGLPAGWSATSFTPDTINPINDAPFAPEVYFTGASSDGETFVAGTSNAATTREGFTQSVTGLILGQEYLISFEQQLSVHPNFDDPGFWIVNFGAQSESSAPISVSGVWVPQEISFVANSTSQALTFTSEKVIPSSGGNSYLGIDGVSITVVPEPSSSATLLCLFCLMTVFHRRKR